MAHSEIPAQPDPSPRKELSPFVSFAILVVAGILSYIAITMFLDGAFRPWRSLPRLLSPPIHIVDADAGDIWVESIDGHTYTTSIHCAFGDTSACLEWRLVKDAADINPSFEEFTVRADSCEKLDARHIRNPLGTVAECIRGVVPAMPEGGGSNTFFALMSDGTIKYQRFSNGHYLMYIICTALATIVGPVLGLMLAGVLYQKLSARRANTA